MENNSRILIGMSLLPGIISIPYFFSLTIGAPLFLVVTLMIGVAAALFIFLKKIPQTSKPLKLRPTNYWVWGVMVVGFYYLVNGARTEAQPYGVWDAWWFWNYHAGFLASPELWKEAYTVTTSDFLAQRVAHADYPLMLPATTAFFWRLLHTDSTLVPFLIGFLFTLMVPLLLFLELQRKNLFVASVIFLGFAMNRGFMLTGVGQVADMPLAFFFLAAFVCMQHFRNTADRRYLLLCGAMLGSCIWLKNEGLMLSMVFLLFHLPPLRSRKHIATLCAGLLPFLLAWAVFKFGYAPDNDLLAGQGSGALQRLTEGARYSYVWAGTKKMVNEFFPEIRTILLAWILLSIAARRFQLRAAGLFLCCIAGYTLVYVLSPHNTEWHVNTSVDRLLVQLIPAFIYSISDTLCLLKIGISGKE
jgi:hypothetical protein